MGNAWIFPSISHIMGKCNEIHGMGKVWKIDTNTFPIVWVLFSHQIPILWYTLSDGKCIIHHLGNAWVSPSIFHTTGKCNKTHQMRRTWEIVTHNFPIVWQVIFSHQILILWYTSSEIHGFRHQFSIVQQNASKPITWGEPGKLVLIFFPQYGCCFPIRFPIYGILHHMENTYVFSSISHNMAKDSQTHRMGENLGNLFPAIFYKAHISYRLYSI